MSLDDPDFANQVYAVVRAITPGTVVTYGEIAAEIGHPGAARAVGRALSSSDDPTLPWWRVVTADGRLVPGMAARHAALLASEGHTCIAGRVLR